MASTNDESHVLAPRGVVRRNRRPLTHAIVRARTVWRLMRSSPSAGASVGSRFASRSGRGVARPPHTTPTTQAPAGAGRKLLHKAQPRSEPQTDVKPAAPKPTPPPPLVIPDDITQPITKLTAEITAAEAALDQAKDHEEGLVRMRGEIQQIATASRAFFDQSRPRLEAMRQQIAALGPAPAKDAPPEADGVAHERFKLNGLAGAMDGAMRTSELIAERASQLTDRLQQYQRDLFTRSLLKRTPSPILPTLWIQLMQESKRGLEDIARLGRNWWSIAEGHKAELLTARRPPSRPVVRAQPAGPVRDLAVSRLACRRAALLRACVDRCLGSGRPGPAFDRLHEPAVCRARSSRSAVPRHAPLVRRGLASRHLLQRRRVPGRRRC